MKASSTRLVFRLSSMGDIILATSALEALPSGESADWVVAREFAALLRGHPRIGTVWEYDRQSGLRGWVGLCKKLNETGYQEVFDLHQSLRTRVARVLFAFWSLRRGRTPRWRCIKKGRARLIGYFLLRRAWPLALRPRPLAQRAFETVAGRESSGPFAGVSVKTDFRHFVTGVAMPEGIATSGGNYICAMPGAQWAGKRWPARRYAEALGGLNIPIVVLGADRDLESRELVRLLGSAGVNAIDGVGKWTLPQVARVLADASAYVGNDTGLAHLAEAVGTRAYVVFGPTAPDAGFGPWRSESRSFGRELWCRPCGKDGRSCFRLTNRYACLTAYEGKDLAQALTRIGRSPAG